MRRILDDFPRKPFGASLAGSQPKLAVRSVDGRYRVCRTDQELLERYDTCEDLAQQLASNCARKASEHPSWTLDFNLSRAREGVARKVACGQWNVSAEEPRWVMARSATARLVEVRRSSSAGVCCEPSSRYAKKLPYFSDTMRARDMRQVLFLDYDGVLHRSGSYVTPHGVVSSAPGTIELFEFATTLLELLEPYPKIEIVLSTDWTLRFGFEYARNSVPIESLRKRVTAATYEANLEDAALWLTRQRGGQILSYVRRHGVVSWLAVDDRRDGFQDCYDHLIHCQTESGLGDRVVIELFQLRLAKQFGEKNLPESFC